MDDPQALAGEIKAFHGINFADLHIAYRQFCKNEKMPQVRRRPRRGDRLLQQGGRRPARPHRLKGLKLPGASIVLDGKGNRFAEVFEANHRRVWVPLADIPE